MLTVSWIRSTKRISSFRFDTSPLHELDVLELDDTGVPERTVALLEGYDLVFSLLRPDDIASLQRVFEVERSVPIVFLLPKSQKKSGR